jgi:hypothetical protein
MRRILLLAIAGLAIFVVVAVLMMLPMPKPMQSTDYLVVGSVATLVGLIGVFLIAVSTGEKMKDVFFKRRRKRR